MSDKALYCADVEVVPAGSADGLLKRTAANTGWEFKTAAQLGLSRTLVQTVFVEQAIDTTTGSASFGDLLTQTITITAGSILLIMFTGSASNTNSNNTIDFQITLDAVAVRGSGMRVSSNNVPMSSAITYRKTGLAAGLHTVKVQWRTGGNTARIRPATTLNEHASLLLQEVTV
jgi:hypothetical protein